MTPNALNYHHLLYFWAVAKEGSLRRTSEVLHVSQPSISAQLKQLEESLGTPLFTRTTRRLILTDIVLRLSSRFPLFTASFANQTTIHLLAIVCEYAVARSVSCFTPGT